MLKVFISPSEQAENQGANDYGTEKVRMFQIANMIGTYLCQAGVSYDIALDTNTLQQSVIQSNASGANIHVALHSNAENSETVRGCEVYCIKGGEAEKLANFLYEEICEETPTEDRGVKDGSHLYECRNTTAPAVLIEYVFHSNSEDVCFFLNHMEDFAISTVNGILKYFGLTPLPIPQREQPAEEEPQPAEEEQPAADVEEWKKEGLNKLVEHGFIQAEEWQDKLNCNIPTWAAFLIISRVYDELKGGDTGQ